MLPSKINIGLIGCGYWGNNILRNLTEQSLTGSITVCDSNQNCIEAIKTNYFSLTTTTNSDDIFNDDSIGAVIIATPTSTHYSLAKQALLKKKHILVEKPLSTSVEQTKELILIAAANKLILMVDHIFLYNPVVRQLKKYITPDFLGKINYIDATRINLGIYQNDINVLWDLACHDISIINFLTEEKPQSVSAIGRINPAFGVEDIAYLFLYYRSGLLVQINSSWASPVKMRKMIIGGEKKMIIYDDIEATNKLIIYDYEHAPSSSENKLKLIDYRLGDITIPKYEISEPLKNVITEFYDCILTGKKPIADGVNALNVIETLEKAQESLALNGSIIPLS
jgi:predicted dehydrogenase